MFRHRETFNMKLTVHDYWRSGASYRLRIALNLKRVAYNQVSHDLRTGEQRAADYLAIAPHGMVPALDVDGKILIQSPAIMEWLEETFPAPPLLPAGSYDRAIVRAMAALIGCDIHPLNNLRVLMAIEQDFGASAEARFQWIARWIIDGFTALETLLNQHGGTYAFGDTPTLADCYIVPQAYSAERFNVNLDGFPALRRVVIAAQALPEFKHAHPTQHKPPSHITDN
jgi:maleylpyruvate isomerase